MAAVTPDRPPQGLSDSRCACPDTPHELAGKDLQCPRPSPRADADRSAAAARELIEKARTEGVDLVGPNDLLAELTKAVLETAREG